jgi:hypothetical protein
LVHVAAVSRAVVRDGLGDSVLLRSPLVRHPLEVRVVDAPVHLVDVGGIQPVLERAMVALQTCDGLIAEPLLVLVAAAQRLSHPREYARLDGHVLKDSPEVAG